MATMALEPGTRPPSRVQVLFAHIMFSGRTAAEAVANNKLRAGLTSLGILFGVALAAVTSGQTATIPVKLSGVGVAL